MMKFLMIMHLTADIRLVSEHSRPYFCSLSKKTLAVPQMHIIFGDRNFAVAGLCLWNGLPPNPWQMTDQLWTIPATSENTFIWVLEITAHRDLDFWHHGNTLTYLISRKVNSD